MKWFWKKYEDVYEVDDKREYEEDTKNKISFTWLVSSKATQHDGILSFVVTFERVDGEGDDAQVYYRWSSAICSDITIGSGYENGDAIASKYADILLQWECLRV